MKQAIVFGIKFPSKSQLFQAAGYARSLTDQEIKHYGGLENSVLKILGCDENTARQILKTRLDQMVRLKSAKKILDFQDINLRNDIHFSQLNDRFFEMLHESLQLYQPELSIDDVETMSAAAIISRLKKSKDFKKDFIELLSK